MNTTIMTREEKAKRYDEALEWMRELYPGLHGATKEDAEHYFPELKESEDERMLRVIRLALTDVPEERFTTEGTSFLKVLAWLEKQKEQKPVTINQDEKEFLADEITAFLCNYDKEFDGEDPVPSEVAEHFYLLGKQAQEQKSAEDWREKRKEECPFRRNLDNNLYGCERYADVISACTGACSWVVDYPKLKEIQERCRISKASGLETQRGADGGVK